MATRASYLSICTIAAGLALSACGGGAGSLPGTLSYAPQSGAGSSPIAHVVLVVQENRSFDNLFALFPGADGATRGKMKIKSHGKYVDQWTKLTAQPLLQKSDFQHCHKAFLTEYDGGKMDGFNLIHKGVCGLPGKPVGKAVYQYAEQDQIVPYWTIAETYVLADHMFQTQGSGSFTAHQDLIRGGTAIDAQGSSYTESLIDNPTGMPWGCNAPPGAVTSLISTSGQITPGPYPCTNKFVPTNDYPTMRDTLDAAGVSWKYYSPCFVGFKGCPGNQQCKACAGALLNAFDVIYPVWSGPEWGTNVSMPETNIFSDITNGQLPAVSWVIPEDANSDHPGDGTVDDGPSWVASIVNAVGQSSYWNSTAVIILWDDWGGFYDNAVPYMQDNQGGLGFRVPMLVVSPYAKKGSGSLGGYVAKTNYEFGSILKYIEQNFHLSSLGTTDKRATSIGNVFNYNQKARTFNPIPSQHSAEYFINHKPTPQYGDPE